METKNFYFNDIWEEVASHPKYDLGRRELFALQRFLPTVSHVLNRTTKVLHLAVGIGREVPYIIPHLRALSHYLLNDICRPLLKKCEQELTTLFPSIRFSSICADIEREGTIESLRKALTGPTLIVLVANGVIFSNQKIDHNIVQAMRDGDLLLLTLEMPHDCMYNSYLIEPIFKLLSQSGIKVTKENIHTWYDEGEQRMIMACAGRVLLSSYKPTTQQLRQRMNRAGFAEAALEEYSDLHMIGSLWRRA